MYVCICNSLKERDIRAQARDGVDDTAEALIESLNGCVQCGLCTEYIECIIEEETSLICEKRQECGLLASNNASQKEVFIKIAAE